MAYFRETHPMSNEFAEFYKKQADLDLKIINSDTREEFPLHVFPIPIQQIVKDQHDKLNFPISYTVCSLLFAASVATGKTYKLRYRWDVKANLFIVLLGKPGTNKSPPVEFAIKPILNKDKKSFHKYEKLMDEYENLSNSNSKKKICMEILET